MSFDRIRVLLRVEGFNDDCLDCEFFERVCNAVPYGETEVCEPLAECTAPDDGACPRLIDEMGVCND